MNRMKKLASMLLALVMVLAMAAPAMAAESYTITINNAASDYDYEAYQIFAGDLSADETKLSNIEWGTGIDSTKKEALMTALNAIAAFKDCKTAADVADVLAKNTTENNDTAKAFADVVAQYLSGDKAEDAYANGVYTITVDAPGYYLVKNAENGVPEATGDTATGSYTRYILEVVKNVTVSHKGTVPSVEKKIVEGSNKVDENEASIGDTINYEFTGTLPSNIADYDTYYYVFTDTLSAGLTYTNALKVTVNDVDVTKYFYVNNTKDSNTNETTITVGIQDLLALELLTDLTVGEITKDTEVVVTYTAELNENANIGTTGNKNDVKLSFSNDPNNDGDGATTPPSENPDKPTPTTPVGETPKDEVYTYTTELIIKKTDEEGNVLTGAAFRITGDGVNVVVTTGDVYVVDDNGTYYKLKDGTYTETAPAADNPETEDVNEDTTASYESTTVKYKKETKVTIDTKGETTVNAEAFVNANGQIVFTGLGAGTYTITEIVTPDGFNTVDPFEVKISWSAENTDKEDPDCTWTYEGTDKVNEVCTNTVTVVNKSGSTLPSTGGAGTTVIYVVGGVLVLAAIVLLITRKRMGAEK